MYSTWVVGVIIKVCNLEIKMAAPPILYNAWFCPFAQRAWIALLEKGVKFEYIEQDPYNKTPEWLAISPTGLVPVIIHNGKTVYESHICIEYVDEAFQTSNLLLPKDPYERARVRILCDFISKQLVPPYYRVLQLKDEADRTASKESITKGLKELFKDFDQLQLFFGGQTLNMVDIMLAPFAYRYNVVLSHFRQYKVPQDGILEAYHTWYKNISAHKSFKDTLPDDDKLIQSYVRYAEDTAKSKVAEAIRKGTAFP